MLKLLKKITSKVIELTEPIQELTVALKGVAHELRELGNHVNIIAHNQAVHHQMIMQMWGVHKTMLRKITENSLDMQMPDIDTGKVDPEDKDAVERAKAMNKPN